MPEHSTGGIARLPSSAPGSGMRHDDPGDEVLAAVLIRMWVLASGRSLRRDVPPDQLSAEELIAFWADDLTPRAGRHAMVDNSDSAQATENLGMASSPAPQPGRRKRRRPRGRAASGRRSLPADPAAA